MSAAAHGLIVSQSILSNAKVCVRVGYSGTGSSESERMIVRILGNYHHADPYGAITGDCVREVPTGIAVGLAKSRPSGLLDR